ncbi:formylglycine-generating enzyme family protein [Roseiconus lacunae]|uniref:Formylglycine-generating enzyme family protein n=1 Tax=Roseiconus lacunae TaxID=2605694 RepID=A0ABT7PJ10_9BACT|nr:formylglycine-generating enzyme family protein [Roseiconus lacunae]MDM4016465.1 formylglycine-generating enzyme family protein [Roseiconus lacunae]
MKRWVVALLITASLVDISVTIADESPRSETANSESHANLVHWIRIPAGTYRRGFASNDRNENRFHFDHPYSNRQNFKFEKPAHQVEISHAFEIAETEITVAQFREFVTATGYQTDAERGDGALGFFPDQDDYVDRFQTASEITWRKPGFEQSDRCPVVAVSWNDAQAFCRWLSEQQGVRCRLPTEAEWEYACRGGTQTWYSWGDQPDDAYRFANVADGALETAYPNTTRYARAVNLNADQGDGHVFTAPVKTFEANSWGLYDMHGNVWEWCQDRWAEDTYDRYLRDISRRDRADFVLKDPLFEEKTDLHQYGDWRVLRGGAWTCTPAVTRASNRTFAEKSGASVYTGFRVVREVAPATSRKDAS